MKFSPIDHRVFAGVLGERMKKDERFVQSKLIAVVVALVLACAVSTHLYGWPHDVAAGERQTEFDASAPEKSGYALVFSDDFSDPSTVDLRNTGRPGYKWYMDDFYWGHPTLPEALSFDSEGITIRDNISTATGTGREKTQLVGQGWSGGAYFEAMLWFDPDKVFVENRSWPAFYGLSWQVASKTDQAPGRPAGYQHFAEIDFMEYGFWNHRSDQGLLKLLWRGDSAKYHYFWQIMHDWYGIKGVTCPDSSWCGISNNAGSALMRVTDIRGWHRYGARWSVGSAARKSFVQAYYDGAPIGEPVFWTAYSSPEDVPTPPTGDSVYSITDFTKFIIVLQANEQAPMSVKYVKVWQQR
ncbi:hypothetical protein [Bradyrhizobium sp. MOS002]|uniref:hypothetical protein n=1 Tax=Bradyrhizobium sp. MOS002 TaxID=2133947 RepID=UPI000D11768B|nr:hypothetical protein [Bradyrhizobium sp. MOS002]PSO25976.1 hypothetical protein C7G41_28770 [Bradyrhizobium sp. MOS002]